MARHPRLLITGAGGQVGTALRPLLPDARFASHSDVDVRDRVRVLEAASGVDLIIHLAANTYVDRCERYPDEADRVNSGGTRNVAEAARAVGARVIYLSTDFVFSGTKQGEYTEEDEPDPINAYGRSKLRGEEHLSPEDVVLRTSWIFGSGRNFIRTILALSAKGPVSVVDDQRGRPTAAAELAEAIVYLIERDFTGAIHIAGDGPSCTWADLAEAALRDAGVDQEVLRIDSETYAQSVDDIVAPRPRNSALCLDKARSLQVPLVDWRSSVSRYVKELS